jgi:acid phosphatase
VRRTLSLPAATVALTLSVAGCSGGSHPAGTAAAPTSTVSPLTSSATPPARATSTRPAARATNPSKANSTPPAGRATKPAKARITKVLVIIEENHSLAEMKSGMPFLYRVATRYGYATDYRAITHPSLPNYLVIAGGSTMGVSDDANPSAHLLHGPSVFGQTLSKGGTAKLYAEALPSPCARTSSGAFAVRHTPWTYFVDERPTCLKGTVAVGTPAAGPLARDIKAGALPTTGMLVPDLVHDAHDGTLGQADAWLKGWLPRLTAGPDFTSGRLAIVVTADEDDFTRVNKVLTVVLAKGLKHKVVSTPLTHYSLTGFIDQVAGARPLRNAAKASSLGAAFGLRSRRHVVRSAACVACRP